MQQDYTPESFKKGQQFEEFVEKNIFTEDRYELITRTNSYEQNNPRFAEDTLKPDFKFRCKETGKEFWVEAKYRSQLPNDQLEALSYTQRDRFYMLEREEKLPVFVIIGYWGFAYKPKALSLIPLKDYKYIPIYRSILRKFQIPITPISAETLKLGKVQSGKATENGGKQKSKKEFQEVKQEIRKSNSFKKYNSKILALAAVGLVAIIMTVYSFTFSDEPKEVTAEEHLKEIITDYYQSMNSNQIEKLPEFLSPQVTSWYDEQNPSREEIYRNAKAHRGKFPFSSSDIDWDSLKVIPEKNGDYHVSYEMIYRSKEKITDDYTVFDLKLITKWDKDFKLKSITEVRK